MVLSLGSPLAAAGALFAGPSASAQAENLLTLPPLPRPRGYQRSEHINTYYRSLRY